MSRCKLRTPWPIHFKLRIVIGIDSLLVFIVFGEIQIFHSRVMGKKVFTNIVWMLTTGVSCALGAVVYSVISWRSVLFVEETEGSGENHRPYASHWQTLSYNVVSSTHRLSVKWQEFLLWDNYILTFNILHSEFLQMECGIRQTLTRWLYMYITNSHLKKFSF